MAEPNDTPSANEPLRALAALIQDSQSEVAESEVAEWADQLDVPFTTDNELRRRLTRQFPEVSYSRISKSFVWDADRPERSRQPEPTLMELCDRWIGDLSVDDRNELRSQIQRRITSTAAPREDVALVQAIDAAEGVPDWSKVPCGDDLSTAMIDRLVERADPLWLLEAAATLSSRRAEPPRKKLQELPVFKRNELAAEAVRRWIANPTPEGSTSKRLRRLKVAIGDEFTPLLVSVLTGEAAKLISKGRVDDEETQRDLSALAFLLAASEPNMAVGAISDAFSDAQVLRQWVLAVARNSKSNADRVALTSLIAASGRESAIFDSAVYLGLDIDSIGKMLSQDDFEPLLERGLGDHVGPAVRNAIPLKIGPALNAVATYPVLEPLVPLASLTNLLGRDEASSRVGRQIAEQLISEALAVERESASRRIAGLDGELLALRTQLTNALDEVRNTEERRAATETKWREAIGQSGAARSAELRQAQIDALRALAENIEDTRSVLATLESTAVVDQHLKASTRRIEAFGVLVEGHPGDTVAYDATIHNSLDVEPGTEVELLTPVYRLADSATPLRYGLVRRASSGA